MNTPTRTHLHAIFSLDHLAEMPRAAAGVKQMAKIQILRMMNTDDDDANGGGDILEYVTVTVSKQKGTAWPAAEASLGELYGDPPSLERIIIIPIMLVMF